MKSFKKYIDFVIDKDDKVLEEFYQTPEYISSKQILLLCVVK